MIPFIKNPLEYVNTWNTLSEIHWPNAKRIQKIFDKKSKKIFFFIFFKNFISASKKNISRLCFFLNYMFFFKENKFLKTLFYCSKNVLKPLPMDRARKMAWKTLIIWVYSLEIWSFLPKIFFDQIPNIRWGFFCLNFFLPKIVKFLTDLPIWLVLSTPFFELYPLGVFLGRFLSNKKRVFKILISLKKNI